MATFELDLYRAQFEAIAAQATELADSLDDARFNWRPGTDKWSIQECLAHLTLTGQGRLEAIGQGIRRGRERGLTGDGPFRYGPVERWFIRATEPPVRRRAPAPRRLRPQHGQPVAEVLPAFIQIQNQLIAQIEAARGLDLGRIRVPSPVSRFMPMSLGIALAQTAAHERRHLQQAGRVRQQLP